MNHGSLPTTSFRDLHHGGSPLLLPNAWDVASAVAFAEAGFPAVGTTSFGVGAAAGHADGARASRDATAALVRALAPLPAYVSADIEDGYADDPDDVAEYVAGLDIAGINIEDSTDESLVDPAAHADKIAAIKRRCPGVFVNARIDNYWLGRQATVYAVLRRAEAYTAAGADGIFVPGAAEPAELRALAAAIPVPVNTLVIPDLPLKKPPSSASVGSAPARSPTGPRSTPRSASPPRCATATRRSPPPRTSRLRRVSSASPDEPPGDGLAVVAITHR